MRRNPKRRRRSHARRGRGRRTRVRGHLRRRRNPSVSVTGALATLGLGSLGGLVAYGVDWGASYAPVGPYAQCAISGVGNAVLSVGTSMLADDRAGAGIAGGGALAVAHRIRTTYALNKATKEAEKKTTGTEAGAVYRLNPAHYAAARHAARMAAESGVVVESGAVGGMRMQTAARTLHAPRFGDSFKEAGASRYVAGPVRWFGPQSWAYDAGVVVRSAHNS